MSVRKNNQHSVPGTVTAFFAAVACLFFSATCVSADKKNKLVAFRAVGQWEIWCIDIAQSGDIQCNLNQVLRYKNHPDFRAMIPRFFTDGKAITTMKIDREWQTGFARGYIKVDNFEPVSLSSCEKQCVLDGAVLSGLINQFTHGNNASIHFHDYLIEEFDVDISLAQFGKAVNLLIQMQLQMR